MLKQNKCLLQCLNWTLMPLLRMIRLKSEGTQSVVISSVQAQKAAILDTE